MTSIYRQPQDYRQEADLCCEQNIAEKAQYIFQSELPDGNQLWEGEQRGFHNVQKFQSIWIKMLELWLSW